MEQTDKFLIVDYSDKAFVIPDPRGSVFAEEFTIIGGKYNTRLTCGCGWVFSKKKHMKQILQMYANYGLTDMVCSVSLTDMGVSKQDKHEKPSAPLPEYILTGDKLKEWNKKDPFDDKIKSTDIVVYLSSGVHYINLQSQPLETRFWFGYSNTGQGETRAQAQARCEYASTHEDYFIEENTSKLRNQLARLKHEYTGTSKYLYMEKFYERWELYQTKDNPDDPNWIDTLNSYDKQRYEAGNLRAITSEERERLIVGYQLALEIQERRCQKYLKRYGLTKIKTGVYWIDR